MGIPVRNSFNQRIAAGNLLRIVPHVIADLPRRAIGPNLIVFGLCSGSTAFEALARTANERPSGVAGHKTFDWGLSIRL